MPKTLIASTLPELFQTGEKWGIVNHEISAEESGYMLQLYRLTLFTGFAPLISKEVWIELPIVLEPKFLKPSAPLLLLLLSLFLYLVEQVEFSQLLADMDLLYFQSGQPQHRELYALHIDRTQFVID